MGIPPGQSSALNLGNSTSTRWIWMATAGATSSTCRASPTTATSVPRAPATNKRARRIASRTIGSGFKRDVVLSDGDLDPRIDFGRDGARIKVVDVNNDT